MRFKTTDKAHKSVEKENSFLGVYVQRLEELARQLGLDKMTLVQKVNDANEQMYFHLPKAKQYPDKLPLTMFNLQAELQKLQIDITFQSKRAVRVAKEKSRTVHTWTDLQDTSIEIGEIKPDPPKIPTRGIEIQTDKPAQYDRKI